MASTKKLPHAVPSSKIVFFPVLEKSSRIGSEKLAGRIIEFKRQGKRITQAELRRAVLADDLEREIRLRLIDGEKLGNWSDYRVLCVAPFIGKSRHSGQARQETGRDLNDWSDRSFPRLATRLELLRRHCWSSCAVSTGF